jgi:hypothetical protein
MQSVTPHGKYAIKLTHIYRQAADNPLMTPLQQLVKYIAGAPPEVLEESEKFIRNQDIVEWYNNDRLDSSFDGVMLAYTNERVQLLNEACQGYREPKKGDRVFSPTTKEFYTFEKWDDTTPFIHMPFGDPLTLGSKYKTLERLQKMARNRFAILTTEEGEEVTMACVFGHYNFKIEKEDLKAYAAQANADIPSIGKSPREWAQNNRKHPLAKARARAWGEFLAFNECVICLDFAHAMTVHKSQGSTYNSVYLDAQDLGRVASQDYTLYLKLMYVALSRASNYVVTN